MFALYVTDHTLIPAKAKNQHAQNLKCSLSAARLNSKNPIKQNKYFISYLSW